MLTINSDDGGEGVKKRQSANLTSIIGRQGDETRSENKRFGDKPDPLKRSSSTHHLSTG